MWLASYRTDEIVAFDADSSRFAGVVARGRALRGPSAVALLADGGVAVASYDNSRVVVFNRTAAAAEATATLSGIAGAQAALERRFVGPGQTR